MKLDNNEASLNYKNFSDLNGFDIKMSSNSIL